ncbi:MAG: amidase, partial [Chloroflexota bacterium]|nr:amidase [Chloroflexota bacterium]
MIEILNKDIFEISELIKKNTISPVDLYNQYSKQIHKYEHKISSFIEIYEDWEEKARVAEKQILNGDYKGPLHGVPIAVKDLIDIKSKVTTAGSKILKNNISNEDADVIKALESSGAIIIGKTQMVEFAFGPHGINSNSEQTKNPWNLKFIPGGSSSGSAAAVASNFSPIAIGSDTGGSI